MIDFQVYSRGNDTIGEGPLWSGVEQTLYWIDIGRKQLHRRGLSDKRRQSWELPDYPGCLASVASPGSIAVAMGDCVQRFDLKSGQLAPLCPGPVRRPGTRFNDGKVDPGGRLWVGTMQNNFGAQGQSIPIDRFDGALYRFNLGGPASLLEMDIGIPNTLAWSPDATRFYFGDSLKETLYVYDFDAEAGVIRNKRVLFEESGIGIPDGSAIDVDGCLWNARWDGSAVVRITPEGLLDRVIELPIPRPTSCAFGGPDFKTLYVTSATHGLTAARLEEFPLSGSVFAIHGAGQGVPVPAMKL